MKKTAIRKLVKTSIVCFFVIFIALGNISLKAQQSATGLSQDEARELWEQRQFEVEDLYMQGELEEALKLAAEASGLSVKAYGATDPNTFNSRLTEALLMAEMGLLEEANVLYEQLLKQAQDTDQSELALLVLDAYADFLGMIDPQMAETVYEEAYQISRSSLGMDDPQTMLRLQALGLNQQDQGRFDQAEEILREAANGLAQTLGEQDPDALAASALLGALYLNRGKLKEAQQTFEKTLSGQEQVLGDQAFETLETKENLAETYRQLGEYEKAEPLFLEVLTTATAELGEEDPLTIQTISHLAQLYEDTGRLEEALEQHRKVYELELALLGETHPNTAGGLNNMASVYRRLGEYEKAEKHFRDALRRMITALGEESPQSVSVMNNLALLLENQGLYDEAEPLFKKSHAISEQIQGSKHPTTLALLNNLAFLYESQGDFQRSELNYEKVIELNKEVYGREHPNTIASINNLAYLYLRDDKPEKAEPRFTLAYDLWRKKFGERHQNTLKALNNLGRVHKNLGNLDTSEKHLTQALEGRTAIFGKKHADTLRSMNDLGELLVLQEKPEEALELFEETLELEYEVLGKSHPYTFETLNNLAQLKEDLGLLDEAFEIRKTGFEQRNTFFDRVLWVAGDNTRQSYIRLHKPEQDAYIQLLLNIDDERTAENLFLISLKRKGLLLKITSETQQVVKMSGSPKLKKLTEDLTEARKELASQTLAGPNDENRDQFGELVFKLEEKINALQLDLGASSQVYRQTLAQAEPEEVLDALGDSALVDFLAYRDKEDILKILALVGYQGEWFVFDYGELEYIQIVISELREIIQDEGAEDEDIKSVAYELWEPLWNPLMDYISDAESIFISPDSVLNVLPFDVLVDDSESYLIENYDLRIISSSRDLAVNLVEPVSGDMLILAGPDFDSKKLLESPQAREVSRKRSRSVAQGARMGSGLRGLNFDPLPGAEKEGEVIKVVSDEKERNTSIFTLQSAEEQQLREITRPPEVLHIATHGFFLKEDEKLSKRIQGLARGGGNRLPPPADNPLLRAGLAFTGLNANAPLLGEIDTDNDGVLTAMEVLNLDLAGTQLVVLSACETGLGEIHEGEGVYGLRRSFQEAGVSNVVNSFWEVSDAGTQLLMTKFYAKFLGGMPAREAMREARLEMLETLEWSAPYYWSAFVLVGRNS